MYTIEPYYEYPKTIEKPKCMYDVPSIYSKGNHPPRTTNEADMPQGVEDLLKLEDRQKRLINQLEELAAKLHQIKQQMSTVPSVLSASDAERLSPINTTREIATIDLPDGFILDVVIMASINSKLIALQILTRWLRDLYKVDVAFHTHSSIAKPAHSPLWEGVKSQKINQNRNHQQIIITLIWKNVGVDPRLMVSPSQQHTAISGEVNIVRYLTYLLLPARYFNDSVKQTEVDHWLDTAHLSVLHGSHQERQMILRTLGSHMEKRQFLVGDKLSIADIGMLGAILETQLVTKLPLSLKRWLTTCRSDSGVSALLDTLPQLTV